jgi:hypothetical protein
MSVGQGRKARTILAEIKTTGLCKEVTDETAIDLLCCWHSCACEVSRLGERGA